MIKYISLTLFLAAVTSATAQEKDSSPAKPTGECNLPDGAKVAPDGSCGAWTTTLKTVAEKKSKGKDEEADTSEEKNKVKAKNQLKVATLVSLEHLVNPALVKTRSSLPMFVVYVCVTTPRESSHDAHAADRLIIAVTDAANPPEKYCEKNSLSGEDCITRSSEEDICQCDNKAEPRKSVKRDKAAERERHCEFDNVLRWCLKKDDKTPSCRYLPLRAGQKLSAWITRTQDSALYAVDRSATGTWTLFK